MNSQCCPLIAFSIFARIKMSFKMAEIFQFEKWLLNMHNNGMDFYFVFVMDIFSIM